ncbi:hypothetical protein GKJPGBOP_01416 [Streptomyces paromomycinus]|uniref:Uncharacterized protein n=2 Tax=Streptomyces paromomycinus TaxID=92743 RepID=A0A401VXH2_STREY|nr:hypothetical protein GKJPGBOP_01416 [Streptomyces paromomycinus]
MPEAGQLLVAGGQTAAGDDERRFGECIHGVEKRDHQVVLPERRGNPEDVGGLITDLLDQVRKGGAELHIGERDLAHQRRARGTGDIADAEGKTRQGKVLRVVQGGQQDTRSRQPVEGFRGKAGHRQPLGRGIEGGMPLRPGGPAPCVMRLAGKIRNGPPAVAPLDEYQPPIQPSSDMNSTGMPSAVSHQPLPQPDRIDQQRVQDRYGIVIGAQGLCHEP